jgi:hypothetical protein
MHDPERWKVFFKDLAAKAEQIAKPQGREIAFEDVRKALEKEVEAIPGGNTIYTVKEFQPDRSQFLNTIRQGPFFIDEGVDHGHGKYSHLMQMLFVYRQIPEGNGHVSFSEFYHHLVTSNPDLWEDMFDASVPPSVTDGSVLLSPRSPEFISSLSDHGDGLPLQPRPFRAPSGN